MPGSSCEGSPDQSSNFVATKLGAPGSAREHVLQVLHPEASVRKGEGVFLWFERIGGSGQKNSPHVFFRIEGGCVLGNAWQT